MQKGEDGEMTESEYHTKYNVGYVRSVGVVIWYCNYIIRG